MEYTILKNRTLWGTIERLIELEDYSLNDMTMRGIHSIFKNMFSHELVNGCSRCKTLLCKKTNELYVEIDKGKSSSIKDEILDIDNYLIIKKTYQTNSSPFLNCLIIKASKKLFL